MYVWLPSQTPVEGVGGGWWRVSPESPGLRLPPKTCWAADAAPVGGDAAASLSFAFLRARCPPPLPQALSVGFILFWGT